MRPPLNDDTQYKYDALSHLRRVELPSVNGNTPVITYEYDQLDRRISRTMTGPNSEPTRKWVYGDGLRIAAELDQNDDITSRFVYSTGRMPVQMIRGNTAYLLVTDYLGSLRMVVRLSDGEVMQRMDYDEFGRVIADEVVSGFDRVPFGYAGGLYDRGTGLVRFGARDYDAETGRWVSKDPVGFAGGGTLLYGYAGGDPVNFVDPNGLAAGDPYLSVSDAVWAAAYEANPLTAEFSVEHSAYIYQASDGSFSYTNLNAGDGVSVAWDKSSLPSDYLKLIALFHTHTRESPFSSYASNGMRDNDEHALLLQIDHFGLEALGSYVANPSGVIGFQLGVKGKVLPAEYSQADSALECSGWESSQ